jgi:hypothetical protein
VSPLRLVVVGGAAVLALGACAAAPTTAAQGPASTPTPSATAPAPVDSATPDPTTPAPSSSPPSTSPPSTPAAPSSPSASTAPAVTGVLASGLVERPAPASVRVGTFAIGDSFLLGSKRALTAAHVRVDAEVGRQFYEGIPELRAVVRSGTLPRNVVVHLGTNGFLTAKHCDSMVATAGPARRVFLVTVIGPRSWMAPNDRVLKACAARHRQQVVVVDWAAVSAPHPNWFGPDRVHPNPTGRKQYNALLLAALREYAV